MIHLQRLILSNGKILHHKYYLLLVQLSCQGSNLDFLESKSSVLPVTPQDNFRDGKSNKKAQSSKKVPSIKNKVLSR